MAKRHGFSVVRRDRCPLPSAMALTKVVHQIPIIKGEKKDNLFFKKTIFQNDKFLTFHAYFRKILFSYFQAVKK